jgi:hypothetical protein
LRLALSTGATRVDLRTEIDPVSETLCFLLFQNSGRWTKSRDPVILSVVHRRQNPSVSSIERQQEDVLGIDIDHKDLGNVARPCAVPLPLWVRIRVWRHCQWRFLRSDKVTKLNCNFRSTGPRNKRKTRS